MKKINKLIYSLLIFLIITPILIFRGVIEYDLRLYSNIKIGTNIEKAIEEIREINSKNIYLLNFFVNRDINDDEKIYLGEDKFFIFKEKKKMILYSGLLNSNYLKNNFYVNNFFNNCYIIIKFNEKEVVSNNFSCDDDIFK